MAQQPQALPDLAEDSGSPRSSHTVAHNHPHNCTSRGANALTWPLGARPSGMHKVYIKLKQSLKIILKIKGKLLQHLKTTVLKSSPRTEIQEGTTGRKEEGAGKGNERKGENPNIQENEAARHMISARF